MDRMICTRCSTIMHPLPSTKGSLLIELVLWFFFIVPGLIYSIWRRSGRRGGICSVCGSPEIVPLDTPRGQELARRSGGGR